MKWPTGRTLGGISALGQRPGTRLGQFQDGQFTSAGLHDFTASLWAAGYRMLHSWLYLVRCAPGDGCSACSAPQPADSWLPLFAPGSAPRRLPRPAQPRTPLPQMPPDSLQGRAGELRSWKTHARVRKGGSAAEEQGVGDKGWRGLGKEGTGARWRGGESELSPLGK